MIAEDPENAEEFLDEGPSKSQLKRDALAVRDLGSELAALSASERSRIPLPEDVAEAIEELNRTRQNGARKRQLGWLAKRMRKIDVEPIEAALESIRQAARANTQTLHLVEEWRDKLLGEHEGNSSKLALTEFLNKYPHADRQQLRQLQRSAATEKQAGKAPRAARLLFKLVRDAVNHNHDVPQ